MYNYLIRLQPVSGKPALVVSTSLYIPNPVPGLSCARLRSTPIDAAVQRCLPLTFSFPAASILNSLGCQHATMVKPMKNLNYYTTHVHFESPDPTTYVSLVNSRRTARAEIDVIQDFPNATEVAIAGLTQDTFEYFVEKYGQQFKVIIFCKCPLVGSLKAIEALEQIEYIVYFWNQRAEHLWDFSKTKALKGFCYDDFRHMHDISEITGAPALEELQFGDRVWAKYILNTLGPIQECTTLKSLAFSAKKIVDGKIEPLARLKQLENISFSSNLFSTEQVAWLKAHLPDTVVSKVLDAYWTVEKPLRISGKDKDTIIVGKRKPLLSSVEDQARIAIYVEQFHKMHQWFLENPKALPDDYRKAA